MYRSSTVNSRVFFHFFFFLHGMNKRSNILSPEKFNKKNSLKNLGQHSIYIELHGNLTENSEKQEMEWKTPLLILQKSWNFEYKMPDNFTHIYIKIKNPYH